jgi:hypothetical protein
MSANFAAGALADFSPRTHVEAVPDHSAAPAPAAAEPVSAGRHEVAVATALGLAGGVALLVGGLVALMLIFSATVAQDVAPARPDHVVVGR